MKTIFLFGILLAASVIVSAQDATPLPAEISTSVSGPGYTNLPRENPDALKDLKIAPKQNTYTRPDADTRRKRYIKSMVGPWALGRLVANAGIATWRNSPEEWEPTWEGFGRRIASGLGKNVIKQTTKFGLDEALKYDSHFYRSKNKSVGARITNALISPVTARDKNGKRVVGVPNLVATYGANIIAYEAWYPDSHDWKDGVRTATISLGFNAAFNLIKEFVLKK